MTVWMIGQKTIGTVLYCIAYCSWAVCTVMHTRYEQILSCAYTRYNWACNQLYSQLYSRLYCVDTHPTGCRTSCTTGLAAGCIL